MNDIPSLKALNPPTTQSEKDVMGEDHFKLALVFTFIAPVSFCY